MQRLLQLLIDGFADGSIYGALGLALALIYRSTGIVNFAQGEMAMVSTFCAWSLVEAGVPLVGAVVAVLAGSLVAGMAVERVAIRPLARRDALATVIATFGIALLLTSAAGLVWGLEAHSFPSLFGDGTVTVLDATVSTESLGTAGVLLAVVGALWLLFAYTPLGLAMRAAASSPDASRLCGVRVGRTLMLGWGLAAMVGALAGILVAPRLFLDVHTMSTVLVYGLAAVAIGGFDSPFGAVLGGWVVGISQSLASGYIGFIGTDLAVLVPFTVIIAVLLVRPHGLFGSRPVVRA